MFCLFQSLTNLLRESCCLPRQDFLVCLHLESSHCGSSPGRKNQLPISEQCRQGWEGWGAWELLAEYERIKCPHLHKAQEEGWWGRGTKLRPILCYTKR